MPRKMKQGPEHKKYTELCRAYVKGQPALIVDTTTGDRRYARVVALGWVHDQGWEYACEVHVEEHGQVLVFEDRIYKFKEWSWMLVEMGDELVPVDTHSLRGSQDKIQLYPLIPTNTPKEK